MHVIYNISVLEVLRGWQLPHNSFYIAVLFEKEPTFEIWFGIKGLRKDGICCRQAGLLVLVITAEFLSVFFSLQSVYFYWVK